MNFCKRAKKQLGYEFAPILTISYLAKYFVIYFSRGVEWLLECIA
jgi:hypothetical protein